ncbi:hypothetical protein V2V00_09770 [Streptococcus agalactiae]
MKEPKTFEEAYKQLSKQLYELFVEPLEPIAIPILRWMDNRISLVVKKFK